MSHFNLKNYIDFLGNPIISILLKNECVLFGEAALSCLYYDGNLSSKEIKCFANSIFRNIIERDLFGKIFVKETVTPPNLNITTVVVNYKCSFGVKIYKVKVIYVTNVEKITSLDISHNIFTTLDKICIDRLGIKHIQEKMDGYDMHDEDIPVPILYLYKMMFSKTFDLIYIPTKKYQLEELLKLTETGWQNKQRSAAFEKKGANYTEKTCDICKENIKTKSTIYELKCKHVFHKSCWQENAYYKIQNGNTKIECPCCRKEYNIYQVL